MVEQPPIREVQTLNFSGATPPNVSGGTVVISGQTVDKDVLRAGIGLDPDGMLVDGDYRLPGQVQEFDISGAAAGITGVSMVIGTVTVPAATIVASTSPADLGDKIEAQKQAIIDHYNANRASNEPVLINIAEDPTDSSKLFFQFDDSESAPAVGFGTLTGGTATGATTLRQFGDEVQSLLNADSRIRSVQVAADGTSLDVRFKASATDVDDIQVRDGAGNLLSDVAITSTTLSASETHTYAFNSAAFASGTLDGSPSISIGGVTIQLDTADTQETVSSKIAANQAAILDANPDVASVQFNSSGQLVITYKPESGNVPNDILEVDFGDGSTTTPGTQPVMAISTIDSGDNSYEGVYRMYAYLNGTETLDLGKAPDPGEPGGASEPGPILVTFNPTNGLLSSVNGTNVPLGGTAPNISITGADPADPTTVIELDITNTTQFASASIVKAATQDGYTKGDLIGVTFAETGEMVASFSNGQTQNLGVVAFATFENQSGLQPAGDTEWIATLTSGDAILNPPGTGLNGSLRSAALEQSNVDLSSELVRLIEAQRNFQANSKTLETLNTVTQAILQI
ncbi:flagellar hook-basal body complex protein [Amphritea spongicola]|nr:flagellar hook-basal body complex protein [Aliamphritea spongicola]